MPEEDYESKYEIIETPRSFIIISDLENRVDTKVRLTNDYHFLAEPAKNRGDIWIGGKHGLFEYQSLVGEISRIVMFDWEQPDDKDNWWPGLKHWVDVQNSKALNGRIHDQWERLKGTINDKILNVHKAMYSHVFRQPEILKKDSLYEHEQLVEDIQDYQACAVALNDLNSLGKKFLKRTQVNNLPNPLSMDNMDITNSSTGIVENFWPETDYNYRFELLQDNWRRFFSHNGELYDELDETIENLPGNLSSRMVSRLNMVKLKRPITNRLEFLTCMSAVRYFNENGLDYNYLDPFMFAKEANVKKAIDLYNKNRMGKHRSAWQDHNDLGYGKTSHIYYFIEFVLDNTVLTEGNIVELTNNAIDQVVIEEM